MSIQRQIEILEPFVTENKKQLIERVMAHRTRFLTVVLEDIHKPHNASAVLRTCECLGIQDVHTIERKNIYEVNPYVLRGASKWLTLHHHREYEPEESVGCVEWLEERGYEIVATTVDDDAEDPQYFDLTQKTAICFGNEDVGVSDKTLRRAKRRIKIPMRGFTESYNLSVSVAIVMNDLMRNLLLSKRPWGLSEEEKRELKLEWYKAVVKNSEIVLANLKQ
ncbi:MAG: RNA methyltransferase [Bacteroidota bacterium]